MSPSNVFKAIEGACLRIDDLAFFWLALRTNFLGFYMNHNEEAKSLTFWRGSEVSQDEHAA